MNVRGSDLEIKETDKYEYILTYSFPCQDLSLAGKGNGMTKGSGTRSGLLWEIERILNEIKTNDGELPQVLLMENVPETVGSKNWGDFSLWEEYLSSLGYFNYYKIMNSKDFGIPQNRERVFMVSVLGGYTYEFPKEQPLTLRLKDMLDKEVDEKYYLTNDKIQAISQWKAQQDPLENMENIDKSGISPTLTARGAGEEHSGMVLVKEEAKLIVDMNIANNGRENGNIYNQEGLSPTLLARDYKDPKKVNVSETKEYANYITWLDDKGRINTQDHRAYFEDRLSGVIPAMERGVPNVLLNSNDGGVVVKEEITLTKVNDNYSMLNGGKWDNLNESSRRVYNENYVSPTITTMAGGNLEPKVALNNLRIRKLTPRECYRLMGFGDEAFDKAQANQSNSALYHQAGDSIVVNVLMAIFKEML
jgi:DNA (cytosine-5)-methyltransferase 1